MRIESQSTSLIFVINFLVFFISTLTSGAHGASLNERPTTSPTTSLMPERFLEDDQSLEDRNEIGQELHKDMTIQIRQLNEDDQHPPFTSVADDFAQIQLSD
ncbi:hypothetical protein M3Y96_01241600 [Aphelenchoides besseyi]|nr:hypothetical protein M3Y96_01241600 [Aphelenchoides besseyi]